MRRRSIARSLLSGLALLALATGTAATSWAAEGPEQVHAIGYPGSVSALAGGTSTALELAVPRGTTPVRVEAVISGSPGSVANLLVGGRVGVRTVTVPASGQVSVRTTVQPGDITTNATAGTGTNAIPLRLQQQDRADAVCSTRSTTLQLASARLVVSGAEAPPTTLASFFPQAPGRVTVVLPAVAPDAVTAAGLAAVAGLSTRYPQATVTLTTRQPAPTQRGEIGDRVVLIAAGSGAAAAQVLPATTIPTLALTGGAQELRRAASALGSPAVTLAAAAVGRQLADERPATSGALTVSLADLGRSRLSLGGYGTSTTDLGVSQSVFGRSVASARLHLVGTHSVLPKDAAVTLEVRWNDYLVAAVDLSTTRDVFTVDADVPASVLQSDNGVQLALHAVPAGGRCERDLAALPFTVDIDGRRSTVTAAPGTGETVGFQRFPQVLSGTLPIGVRGTGEARTTNAVRAAGIVAALARAARTPLDVRVVDADTLLEGGQSGIVVGAGGEDSNRVNAPLRLFGVRLLSTGTATQTVGTDTPYAALQVAHSPQRDLLLLGGWDSGTGQSGPLLDRLAARIGAGAWSSLSGDIYLANPGGQDLTLTARDIYPQAVQVQERRDNAWWLAVAGAALGLIVLARVLVGRRRQREIADYVQAQERRDAAGSPDAPPGT